MKKNFKKLVLNKSTLSNLENSEINGGLPILSLNDVTCYQCPSVLVKCDASFYAICKISQNVKCLPDPNTAKGCTAPSLCVKCHG